MTSFVHRACCADRADDGIGWTMPAGESFIATGPVLDANATPPARSLSVAIHESAHCALALALGGRCSAASCLAPAHATTHDLDPHSRIVMTLAGEIAENWQRRTVYRPADEAILPWLAMIRAPGGGYCDGCKVLRGCVVLSRHGADDQVLAIFRRLEAAAIRLVTDPVIWRAITDLAAVLLIEGKLDEAAINAIAARHFRPGEFVLSTKAKE